ncbi:TetR/AcrR family transcriptional regulator [Herbaspirillum sp. NPDC087042]|uniref:TetR/AcrR family transcriptional regulator n=1 Tax=Herbaspirillum sp. NPDC087042 TaxID=3364004 RepID=UPI0037FBB46B
MNTLPASKKEQSHQRIVAAAARVMRRSGFKSVNVAEVMKEAGLTHGGFYAHFASRDALLAEAVTYASRDSGALVGEYVEKLSARHGNRFKAFIESYLSDSQITGCENGCPVAALCSEMHSQAPEVVESSRQAITSLQKLVRELLPEHHGDGASWMIAATISGAMQMARVLGDGKQGPALLAATRDELLERYAT